MDQFDETSELVAHMARRRAELAASTATGTSTSTSTSTSTATGTSTGTATAHDEAQHRRARDTSDFAAQLAAADADADSSDDALRAHIEARRRLAQATTTATATATATAAATATELGSIEIADTRSQLLEDLFSSCQAVPVTATPAPAPTAPTAAPSDHGSLAAALAAFDSARAGEPMAAVVPEPSVLPAGVPAAMREETAMFRKQVESDLDVFRRAFIPGFITEHAVAEKHMAAGGRLLGSALQITAALRQRQQLLETGLAARQTVAALARFDALEAILAGREAGGLQLPAPLLNHSSMRAFAARLRDDVAALRAEIGALTQMFARVGLAVHDVVDPALKFASSAFAQLTLITAEIQPTLRLMRAQLEKHRITSPTMEEVFANRPVITTDGRVVAEHASEMQQPPRGPAVRGPAARGPAARGPAAHGPAAHGPAAEAPPAGEAAAAEAAAVAAAARAYAAATAASAAAASAAASPAATAAATAPVDASDNVAV